MSLQVSGDLNVILTVTVEAVMTIIMIGNGEDLNVQGHTQGIRMSNNNCLVFSFSCSPMFQDRSPNFMTFTDAGVSASTLNL